MNISSSPARGSWFAWLLGEQGAGAAGPSGRDPGRSDRPWWVMCLAGLAGFSTLGYLPGIAFAAAGPLSPVAMLLLAALILLGALPVYRRVAAAGTHGDGTAGLLEQLGPRWPGKLFVLALLGFAAAVFIITVTLAAAVASTHLVHNPFVRPVLDGRHLGLALLLIGLLGVAFLVRKGFREAAGTAMALVVVYLGLNVVVIAHGLQEIAARPHLWAWWQDALVRSHPSPFGLLLLAWLVLPQLAPALGGFETGVAAPRPQGAAAGARAHPAGSQGNAGWLLGGAALIMCVLLVLASLISTLLIPTVEFAEGGRARGRALAFLAHRQLGEGFGSAYDLSTVLMLWLAAAGGLLALLKLVRRALPRLGMTPDWARATRPLVLLVVVVACAVTAAFEADVHALGAAYATSLLAVMTTSAAAVTLHAARSRQAVAGTAFGLITLVFACMAIVNVVERPGGVYVAALLMLTIVVASLLSRALRSTEPGVEQIEVDEYALALLAQTGRDGTVRLIVHQADDAGETGYLVKERGVRRGSLIPAGLPVLFLEVRIRDAGDPAGRLHVRGNRVGPHGVVRLEGRAAANDIAAFALWVRDHLRVTPHVYFERIEGSPRMRLLRFLLFGEGETAPLTREVLRAAEPDAAVRPVVHPPG